MISFVQALYPTIQIVQDRSMQSQHYHTKTCRHLFRSY
nr:MAG TPA: hypothetical protein [Caudoviricetes sp.]